MTIERDHDQRFAQYHFSCHLYGLDTNTKETAPLKTATGDALLTNSLKISDRIPPI